MTMHYPEVEPDASARPLWLRGPGFAYDHLVKRGIDILFVLTSLPIVLPVILFLALAIWARDGRNGPFFRQKRLGREGRIFTMWKLRSMVVDADSRLAAHLEADPEARAEWEAKQKLRHDPRVTRLGAFLRRSSLDELPQLWNVLKGDMSLVGPRPMLPEQRSAYPGHAYEQMRPGLTGLWQVSARNGCDFADRAMFDTQYFKEMSLLSDLRVILDTVRVVLRGTGC